MGTVGMLGQKLHDKGGYEISLGDTIGVGTARLAQAMIEQVSRHVPVNQLAAHFHDTYGHAPNNILASIEHGITAFDTSVGGLGGCPYAPGAPGNVSTEAVIRELRQHGHEIPIDLPKLASARQDILQMLSVKKGS